MIFSLLQIVSGGCRPYSFWPSSRFRSGFGVFLVIIEFIGPLVILIFCYGRIVWILSRRMDSGVGVGKDHGVGTNTGPGVVGAQNDTFQLARRNTLKTFFLISVCFVLCWTCNQTLYLMHNFGFKVNWNGVLNKFGVIMAFTNCTINPFVYLVKYKDYQKALKGLFGYRKASDDSSLAYSRTISTSVATIAT